VRKVKEACVFFFWESHFWRPAPKGSNESCVLVLMVKSWWWLAACWEEGFFLLAAQNFYILWRFWICTDGWEANKPGESKVCFQRQKRQWCRHNILSRGRNKRDGSSLLNIRAHPSVCSRIATILKETAGGQHSQHQTTLAIYISSVLWRIKHIERHRSKNIFNKNQCSM
jgi:hypothetical protein